jgi:hypothetical protein
MYQVVRLWRAVHLIFARLLMINIVLSNKHGSGAALVLLSQADVEDHTPLDWAADTGDVNQIEFLLRKGLDLHRVDVEGRGALFWAVRSGRVEATRFLVRCGCDPHCIDRAGESPYSLGRKSNNSELISALNTVSFNASNGFPSIETDIHKPVVVPTWLAGGYKSEASGPARSLAIYRHHPSRLSHVLIYGTVVFIIWMLSLVIPFYIWILSTGTGLLVFRYLCQPHWFTFVDVNNTDISKITHVQCSCDCRMIAANCPEYRYADSLLLWLNFTDLLDRTC